MKHVAWTQHSLLTICFVALFACPSTQTVRLRMDRVEVVEGTLRGQAFDISIYGTGFGLEDLRYDVLNQTGSAEKPAYQLRIVSQSGDFLAVADANQIELRSPTKMVASFILPTPLELGVYDLELTIAGQIGVPIDTLRNGIRVEDPEMMTMDAGYPGD